jgi:hypothetical protein
LVSPGPALLLNRAGLVAQELASQLARQLLIEQNAHARSARHGRFRVL